MLLKYQNLDELESSIQLDLSSYEKRKINMIVQAMKQLNQVGRKHFENDAKEDAYCHFFRYMTLFPLVVKSDEFRRNPDLYKKDLSAAPTVIEKLELLKDDLIQIYSKEQQKKTESVGNLSLKTPTNLEVVEHTKDILKEPAILVKNNFWIGLDCLIGSIKSNKQKFSYMILDTRPADDYKRSHLYYHECYNINVPVEKLPRGTSASMVEKILDNESKEIWLNRTNYQFIILMGEMDSPDNLSEITDRLLRIMIDWDPNTQYRHPPILLDGGYMNFIFKYPTFFTAAIDTRSRNSGDEVLLHSIDYPALIDQTTGDPAIFIESDRNEYPDIDDDDVKEVSKTIFRKNIVPTFDRSKKPILNYTTNNEIIDIHNNDLDQSRDLSTENGIWEDLDKDTDSIIAENVETSKRSKPKQDIKSNQSNFHLHDDTTKKQVPQPNAMILKQLKVVVPRINNIPYYDRSKKPKIVKPPYNPNRYTPKSHGSKIPGCVGFINQSNICYVNSVIQIMLNLKEFRNYLLNNTYLYHLKQTEISGGNICQELAQICETYWSEDYTTMDISPLKENIGRLNSRFARDTQEDSHEFFMILIHYLHEELSYSIPIPENATEPEAKFFQYMNNKNSFINNYFFGQSQTYVLCQACGYTSATYTPFGCLTLEIVGDTLEDCIGEHYRAEEVDDFRCEKCNIKGTVTKETNIYRAPKYLTIHLKRFKDTGLRHFNKKLDPVAFPLLLKLATVSERDVMYDLMGVCVHQGTLDHGHYRAYVNSEINAKWMLFDDAHVSPVKSLLNVRSINRDAYMLFYKIST